jgi:predicted amidophosphoribosyltransferase
MDSTPQSTNPQCPACRTRPTHGILPLCSACWAPLPVDDKDCWDIAFQHYDARPSSHYAQVAYDRMTRRVIRQSRELLSTTSKS